MIIVVTGKSDSNIFSLITISYINLQSDSYSVGRRFESCRAHQPNQSLAEEIPIRKQRVTGVATLRARAGLLELIPSADRLRGRQTDTS